MTIVAQAGESVGVTSNGKPSSDIKQGKVFVGSNNPHICRFADRFDKAIFCQNDMEEYDSVGYSMRFSSCHLLRPRVCMTCGISQWQTCDKRFRASVGAQEIALDTRSAGQRRSSRHLGQTARQRSLHNQNFCICRDSCPSRIRFHIKDYIYIHIATTLTTTQLSCGHFQDSPDFLCARPFRSVPVTMRLVW